ncbi:sulfite exporter TauE/SafE family protein [Salinicola acroporae]|uniref:sulfite exporter TauE/SafE family protein n=1 Tax=Salinicola acroporae TaxID=1541440 RepID=UPI002453D691|nr:sulfite exporter TauE/SafE family protein [Salinicola acroporae]
MSSMPLLWPAITLACFAGLVRGYCGFGFAMLMALGLMLFLPPLEAVPLALLLDLITSIGLWRRACRLADWPRLRRLLLGMLAATVVGVSLITSIPASPMRISIALLALAGALALLWRREPPQALAVTDNATGGGRRRPVSYRASSPVVYPGFA